MSGAFYEVLSSFKSNSCIMSSKWRRPIPSELLPTHDNLLSRVSCGILYDAVSVSDNVTSNGNTVDELGKIWKEAVVAAEIRTDRIQDGSLKC
jgi:hypothetical protein